MFILSTTKIKCGLEFTFFCGLTLNFLRTSDIEKHMILGHVCLCIDFSGVYV